MSQKSKLREAQAFVRGAQFVLKFDDRIHSMIGVAAVEEKLTEEQAERLMLRFLRQYRAGLVSHFASGGVDLPFDLPDRVKALAEKHNINLYGK